MFVKEKSDPSTAASTCELVVGGVGGPTVSQDASKVIGVALVWRGGELCRVEFCLVGKGEARGGVRRRFLLREAGLRGRRPWEVVWLWREGEREGDREGWRGLGRA